MNANCQSNPQETSSLSRTLPSLASLSLVHPPASTSESTGIPSTAAFTAMPPWPQQGQTTRSSSENYFGCLSAILQNALDVIEDTEMDWDLEEDSTAAEESTEFDLTTYLKTLNKDDDARQ